MWIVWISFGEWLVAVLHALKKKWTFDNLWWTIVYSVRYFFFSRFPSLSRQTHTYTQVLMTVHLCRFHYYFPLALRANWSKTNKLHIDSVDGKVKAHQNSTNRVFESILKESLPEKRYKIHCHSLPLPNVHWFVPIKAFLFALFPISDTHFHSDCHVSWVQYS